MVCCEGYSKEGDKLNAARQLAAIFDEWRSGGQKSTFQVRGANGLPVDHPQLWANFRDASALMHEVEDAVRDLEASGASVPSYRKYIPRWWTALVLPQRDWSTNGVSQGHVIDERDLDMLDALGSYLDQGVPTSREPDKDAVDRIMEMLDDVASVASNDLDLAHSMRTRIAGLINSVKHILSQYSRYSPEQLQHVLDELAGVTARAAVMSNTPATKEKWLGACANIARSMLIGFFQGAGSRGIESMGEQTMLESAAFASEIVEDSV